jgi:hypothetical protein
VAAEVGGRGEGVGVNVSPALWHKLRGFPRFEGTTGGRLRRVDTKEEIAPTVTPWSAGYYEILGADGRRHALTVARVADLARHPARRHDLP